VVAEHRSSECQPCQFIALFHGHPDLSGTGSYWKSVEEQVLLMGCFFFNLSSVAKFGHVLDKHLSWWIYLIWTSESAE